jgi:hypothetical protein
MTTYNLTSTDFIHAPSIFSFARQGYLSASRKKDKETFLDIILSWKLPREVAIALLSGKITTTITEDQRVTFSI